MKIIAFILLSLTLCGCQTLKDYFNGGAKEQAPVVSTEDIGPKYSETSQYVAPADRQYKRMTRSKMEEESELQSNAGSLWVMDGQQSYLFAQNKTRREGDILNVKLEGSAMKQVETKVSVIKKLLKQLEEEEKRSQMPVVSPLADNVNGDRNPASVQNPPAAAKPVDTAPAKEEKQDLSDIQTIQAQIVERMPDGNYRVKGAQPFMIGQKEYKVIATGIIRPEDYNDEGISSGKLLDPQFDVVSVRRKSKDDKTALF